VATAAGQAPKASAVCGPVVDASKLLSQPGESYCLGKTEGHATSLLQSGVNDRPELERSKAHAAEACSVNAYPMCVFTLALCTMAAASKWEMLLMQADPTACAI
jgi:hypothetical protein